MHPQPPTELARAIVAQVAPTELPLFTAISKAYAETRTAHARGAAATSRWGSVWLTGSRSSRQ
jgi:hypothetical protein